MRLECSLQKDGFTSAVVWSGLQLGIVPGEVSMGDGVLRSTRTTRRRSHAIWVIVVKTPLSLGGFDVHFDN